MNITEKVEKYMNESTPTTANIKKYIGNAQKATKDLDYIISSVVQDIQNIQHGEFDTVGNDLKETKSHINEIVKLLAKAKKDMKNLT